MTEKPLVTIITPTYNRAGFLRETIESVLSQDYEPIEYIVLDDGSQDNTMEILKEYEGKIIWQTHANMGETLTVNKGFSMSTGQIIGVVNSDDPILPGAVKKVVGAFEKNKDALVVYPDWAEIDKNSNTIKKHTLPNYNIYNMVKHFFNIAIGPGTFFRREALEKYGARENSRRYTGDLEYWCRLSLYQDPVHIPEVLATHRTHDDSAQIRDMSSAIAEELISIVVKLYNNPALPKELRRIKGRVFSNIYHEAAYFCNKNEKKQFRHYRWLKYRHYPPSLLKDIMIKLLPFFYKFVLLLNKTLPPGLYKAIRSVYRKLRKENNPSV